MTINIPTSLQEITLRQYAEFENSDKTNQDIVSIFCGLETTSILNDVDVRDISMMCQKVLQMNPKFIRKFKYNGVNYGFIPKLDEINLSTSEFIDLEMYMAKPETFHKAMSILYRPITKTKKNWFKMEESFYDIENYKGASDVFIDAPVEYYFGACAFFFDLLNDLNHFMLDYSKKILKKKGLAVSNNLTENGDGMLVSEQLQN